MTNLLIHDQVSSIDISLPDCMFVAQYPSPDCIDIHIVWDCHYESLRYSMVEHKCRSRQAEQEWHV